MLNVAEALKNLMDADLSGPGQTFNLAGPKTYTHAQFMALYREFTFRKPWPTTQHYPKVLLKAFADASNKALWWPFIDGDLVERQYISEPTDFAIRHRGDGSLSAEKSWQTLLAIDSMAELDTVEDEAIRYWKLWRAPCVCLFLSTRCLNSPTDAHALDHLSLQTDSKDFQKPAHIGSKCVRDRLFLAGDRRSLTFALPPSAWQVQAQAAVPRHRVEAVESVALYIDPPGPSRFTRPSMACADISLTATWAGEGGPPAPVSCARGGGRADSGRACL